MEVSPRSHSNGGGRPRPAGSPPMPPADLSPSANPGTMRARAIQAFQHPPPPQIPPLKSRDLTQTPSPGLEAGGEGGREGDALSLPHPAGLPLSLRVLRTRGCSEVGRTDGPGLGAVEDGDRKLRLAAPVPGCCSRTPVSSCFGGSPKAKISLRGSPSTLRYTHLPSSSPPGAPTSEQRPQRGVLT